MRIAFLLPSTFAIGNPGNGILAQARYQAEALERLGHEVIRLQPWQVEDAAEFDIVHFFLGGMHTAGIESLRSEVLKMLVFAPIIDSNESNWRYRWAMRLGLIHPKVLTVPAIFHRQAKGSDLVIARSKWERNRIVRGLGIAAEKVEIALNGVPPMTLADPSLARGRLNLPDDYCLHVSAYTQGRKNVHRLIEAVGPTKIPMVIAGHAPDTKARARLSALADRYPTVRILGWQDRQTLLSLYAGCKVFCLPSEHEGTGLAALEAAAYGANVVITAMGGPTDYFLDMAEYVDPTSTIDIREAVLTAWDQPKGTALQDHIRNNLTWRRSAENLVAAYRKHTPC